MEGVKNIKNFWPINLVGCIYKLISKVLARSLSMVLEKVIGEFQHTFIEGRQILDAVMVTSKIADEVVGSRKKSVLCKLDMEKAYDHVNWKFVDYMLGWMGFG